MKKQLIVALFAVVAFLVLAGEDGGGRAEAVLDGVESDDGFAFGSNGSGGLLRVGAICILLLQSTHKIKIERTKPFLELWL